MRVGYCMASRRPPAAPPLLLPLLLATQALLVGALGTNWASLANGGSATSSGVGSWAGVFRYANNSIDGHRRTYWSDDGLRGGVNKDLPAAGPDPSCAANLKCASASQVAAGLSYAYPFCATYPFWLRVRLAQPTLIQTVELVINQDMTYDVQTGSSPAGPWTTQVSRPCTICKQNNWTVTNPLQIHVFPAAVTTQYIQIAIKYSGAAGPGACGGCLCVGQDGGGANAQCTAADFCSWSTNIYELGAFSPSAVLWSAPPPPAAPPTPFPSCPASLLIAQNFVGNGSDAAGYILSPSLSLNKSLYNILDPLVSGRGLLVTTLGSSQQEGTVELKQTANWLSACKCGTQNGGAVVTANITSGGGNVTGDGVLLALVDSTRQTAGSTSYMTVNSACGLTAVRPLYALILEFTTRDTNSCGAGGTTSDLRLVRTYGPNDAAVELVHTRQAGNASSCAPACILLPYMYSGAWWEAQIVLPTYTPGLIQDYADTRQEVQVFTDGTLRMTLANNSLVPSSFYVVAGGRNSGGSTDRNGVANVHVDCVGNRPWAPDHDVAHQFYAVRSAAGAVPVPRVALLAAAALALLALA